MIKRYKIEFEHWRKWFAVLSALIMFLAFQMKYDEIDFCGSMYRDFVANILDSFQEFRISSIIMFPLLYIFAEKSGGMCSEHGTKMDRGFACVLFFVVYAFGLLL